MSEANFALKFVACRGLITKENNNRMKEHIKKEMSNAIGSYSNSLTDSIAERCTEIALKYVEQSCQADVGGSLLDKAIELFDMLSDGERIIVMDGYCKGCGRKQDGGICSCVDF